MIITVVVQSWNNITTIAKESGRADLIEMLMNEDLKHTKAYNVTNLLCCVVYAW